MPRTIDDKIVEMRFDNRDFEKNTKQSMATLDKLKTSLDMTDAERNFNKISKASGEVSFTKASDSVDTFSVKLSAMSSVAVAAIGRITNQLMDLGEQFIRNLSGIDYMSAGFSKYEDIIGYQQTMLANAKNMSEAQMQELLDKLVWFSDETSFNADNMMQAMSSYIAAGADELTSQAAALGTALWAALTGNSNESLAIANRNLPQIFGKGYMQLQDWQSIVTAKMDAPWIREMFIETAGELKTLEKRADGFYTKIGKNWEKVDTSSFTSTFKGGWLNTEVLLKTFAKITKFTDEVYDEVNETGDLAFDVIRRLGKDIDDVGYKALKGAQETKTWTEAWEYVKGAVTAGWSRTFETLFGSFNTARDFFSSIVESLYSIFVEPGNTRNNIFKAWAEYTPYVAKDVEDTADAVNDIVTKLENARDIVLSIIRGNYGNGAVRVKALAEKYGADVGRELQLVVNEVWKQWDGENWSLNYELLDEITANGVITRKTSDAIKAAAATVEGGAEAMEDVEEVLNGRDDLLDGLSALAEGIAFIFDRTNYWFSKDSSLKALKLDAESLYKFTHKFADGMREFRDNVVLPDDYDETMKRLREGFYTLDDIPEEDRAFYTGEKGFTAKWVYPLIRNLGTIGDIVNNLLNPIRQVFKALKDGFLKAFFPDGEDTMYDYQVRLSQFLNKVKELTETFKLSDEQAAKLSKIFQALFTPIRIIGKIIGTVSTTVTDLLSKTNKGLGGNSILDKILSIGEAIADVVIGFDEWLEEAGVIDGLLVPAIQFVSDALSTVWDWLKKLLHIDSEGKFPTFDDLFAGWQNIKDWLHTHIIKPIEETFNIDLHIPTWDEIMSTWGKIKDWVTKNVVNPFSEAFTKITGKKFELHWPTFDDIKSGWENAKNFVETKIIQPIENLLGIDIRMPKLEDIKNFFSKIGEFFAKIFDDSNGDSIFTRIGSAVGSLFGRRGDGLGTGPVGEGSREYALESVDGLTNSASRAQQKVSTFESVLEKLGAAIKKIFTFIGDLITEAEKNPMLNFAVKGGIFMVILEMISRLVDTAYKFLNFTPLLNMQLSLGMLAESFADIFYSIGEVNKTKAVKNLATSVAILVGSVFLLALIPVDAAREGVQVILELVAAMGAIAILMAKMSKTGSFGMTGSLSSGVSLKGTRTSLGNIGLTLILMAASIAILAHSLKSIAKFGDIGKLQQAMLILEELLFSLVLVMVILNRQSKVLGKGEKLSSATVQFFAIGLLISNLVNAIIKLSKIDNYDKAFKQVEELLLIIEGMVVIIAWLSTKMTDATDATKLVPKLVTPILAITVLIVALLAAITVLVKVLDEKGEMERFSKIADVVVKMLAISVGIISALALMAKAKGATVKIKDGSQFIKMAAGISVLTAALATLVVALTASFALILHEIGKGMTNDQMLYAIGMLAGIGVIVLLLVGVATAVLQNSARWDTSALGVAAVGVVLLAIAAMVTSITLSFAVLVKATQGITNNGALAIAVGAVAATIAIILGAVVLILRSFKSGAVSEINKSIAYGQGGVSVQLAAVALILLVLGRVMSKITKSLAFLVLAVSAAGNWESLAVAAGALAVVMGVILASLALVLSSLYKFNATTSSASDSLKLVSLALVIQTLSLLVLSIGVSLTLIVHELSKEGNSWTAIIAPLISMVVMIGVLVGAVAILNKMFVNGADLLYIAGAISVLSLNLIAIAIALGGLTAVIGNTNISGSDGTGALIEAVKGIGIAMAILLAAAYIASNPMMERGFRNLTWIFIGISTIAASFAVAIGIIVIALLAFKDAVYDIADNYEKFERGVIVLFYSIAEAFSASLPAVLSAVMKSGDEIAKALLTMLVQLMINVKKRLPDIIKQLMETLIVSLVSIKDYIGPLVAVIFDFIVELLEGVAYAINTRGGQIVGALLDVIGSIIVLANNVLSGLIGSILRSIGLGGAADVISDIFDHISTNTAVAMAKSGDDIIRRSNIISQKIMHSSPRLMEYYKKYGDAISSAIDKGTEGITTSLSLTGSALGNGIDLSNLGFDTSALSSFGELAGKDYTAGVANGITPFSVSDMFPTVDDYYDYGYDAAEAQQSGYTKALIDGIKSGKITSLDQVYEWQKRTGASDEFVDKVIDMMDKREITTLGQIEELYQKDLDAAAATEAVKDAVSDLIEQYNSGGDKSLAKYNLDAESPDVHYRSNTIDYMLKYISNLSNLIKEHPELRSEVGPEIQAALANMQSILSHFGYSEYKEASKAIDFIMGYTDESVDMGVWLDDYLDARAKEQQKAADAAKLAGDIAAKKYEDKQKRDEWFASMTAAQNEFAGNVEMRKNYSMIAAVRGMSVQLSNIDALVNSSPAPSTVLNKLSPYMRALYDFYSQNKDAIESSGELEKIYAEYIRLLGDPFAMYSDNPRSIKKSITGALGAVKFTRDELSGLLDSIFPRGAGQKSWATLFGEAKSYLKYGFLKHGTDSEFTLSTADMAELLDTIIPGKDWHALLSGKLAMTSSDFSQLNNILFALGIDLGAEYIKGIVIGINDPKSKSELEKASFNIGNDIIKSTKQRLEIKSPSRVGKDIGRNFVLGVAEGVEGTTDEAGLASEETALSMAQRLKDAISAAVGFNLEDLSPVIRPILDLDAITAGASQINGLVGGNIVYGRFGVGPAGYGDLQAIAQLNKTGLAQAIQESVLSQPVNQVFENTFNIQSNDPNEVARRVSAILSNQVQRKQQVWGPARVTRATQ